jgi:multiple sugar transport system permease protein
MTATPIRQPHVARQENARYLWRGLWYFVCVVLTVWFLFPIGWSIITSLKPASEINAVPLTFLPKRFTLENYTNLNKIGSGIVRYTTNSVLVSLYTITGTILLSTLAGYGFARFNFRGKAALFIMVLAPLMIPFQAIMIPLFLVLRALSLNNTLPGLAMVYITAQLPFGIFIMRNVFATVPRDIEEAALIDGCSPTRMLYRVMLPLVMPGIITIGLFAFFNAWNELFAALIYLTDSDKYTLPLLLATARTNPGLFGGTNWGGLQASVTITMVPCLLLFIFLQRYYVGGLTSGSVK